MPRLRTFRSGPLQKFTEGLIFIEYLRWVKKHMIELEAIVLFKIVELERTPEYGLTETGKESCSEKGLVSAR